MDKIKLPWPEWKEIRKIGKGGYGTVYEISRTDKFGVEERAAVKVIRFPQDDSENDSLLAEGYDKDSITAYHRERLDKVINEYAVMMQMKGHRNIVRCDDCASVPHVDGMGWDVYIRMELLTSLHTKLKQGPLSETEVIKLGKDLCQALMLCEEKNIVHRDIKPENIFVNEYGDYKLGDFGISRTMEHTTNATRTGSPRFMAPEVYKDQKYGSSVDIYSLGLVMYWLLNNYRMPFLPIDRPPTLQENEEALQKRVEGVERLPEPINGRPALKHIVMKACSFHPKDRYTDSRSFFHDVSLIDSSFISTYDEFTSANDFPIDKSNGGAYQMAKDDLTVAIENSLHPDYDDTIGIPCSSTKKESENSDFGYSITKTYKVMLLDTIRWGIDQKQDDIIARTTVSDILQTHNNLIPSFCEIMVYLADRTPVFLWEPVKQEIEFVDPDFNPIRSIPFFNENHFDSADSYIAYQSEIYQVDLPFKTVSWGEDEKDDFDTSRAVIIDVAKLIEQFDFESDDYSIVAFQWESDEKAFWYDECSKVLVLYDQTGHNQRISLQLDDSIYQVNENISMSRFLGIETGQKNLPPKNILPFVILFIMMIGLILFQLSQR